MVAGIGHTVGQSRKTTPSPGAKGILEVGATGQGLEGDWGSSDPRVASRLGWEEAGQWGCSNGRRRGF